MGGVTAAGCMSVRLPGTLWTQVRLREAQGSGYTCNRHTGEMLGNC